jgi:hypothetical protein
MHDYEEYLEEDPFGPYEEDGYTGRPVPVSNTRVGTAHHPDCPYGEFDPDFECCNALWEADYQAEKERDAEELHEEWWQ